MARLVEEIMNRELFAARRHDRAGELMGYFSALGIGASPVLSPEGELLGMVSLRDLVRAGSETEVHAVMARPVATVEVGSTIEEAARIVGETGFHRLPVVDESGRVVGIVSTLDLVRGLVGVPTRHLEAFVRRDDDTGLIWSDDVPLELDRIEAAPQEPGVLAIVHGGPGVPERVVWAEMAQNMRARLIDILSSPQNQYPTLRHWLGKRPLRFRCATPDDADTGRRVVDILQRRAGYAHIDTDWRV